MAVLKRCSKEELDQFVATYPRELVAQVLRITEPDQMQYNDFTLGVWPDSVVASYQTWGHPATEDSYGPDPGNWCIAE